MSLCDVCEWDLSQPDEKNGWTARCDRCADMNAELRPPVVEWIKDVVRTAIESHMDDVHRRKEEVW